MFAAPWPHRPTTPCDALHTGELVVADGVGHCSRCPHPVQDLRGWTRERADAFVHSHRARGERMCVVVAAAPNGDVSFAGAPELVPLTRLMKRLRAPGLASGFALAMACSRPLAGAPPPPEPTPAPAAAEVEAETDDAPVEAETASPPTPPSHQSAR